jgi:iron-sulfur cluster repair protein YtfE (RIC family)
MRPSDELRYDHEVLRGKLDLLEEELPSLPRLRVSVSKLTDSLASCLRSHAEREERLLAGVTSPRIDPFLNHPLQHVHDDHLNERIRLAVLHGLLAGEPSAPQGQVITQASDLIKELREHMAEEEACVFPLLDRGNAGGP